MLHNVGRRMPRVVSASRASCSSDDAVRVLPARRLLARAARSTTTTTTTNMTTTATRSFATKPPTQPPPPPPPSSSSPQAPNPAGRGPGNDGRSFRGQMLESINARMAREQAERAKLAQTRQTSAGTRNTATTFMLLFVGVACYFLGTKTPRDPDPASTLPLAATRPPRHHTSRAELEAAWADFVAIVGEDNVSTNPDDIRGHAISDWSSHQDDDLAADRDGPVHPKMPFCVLYPGSTDDVSRIMHVCHTRRIPVTGYSGGTSLEGNFAPTRGGVPGLGWEALNETLAELGLFFPPDPGPGAQIGGMIGTGCSGTNAYRYGTMRDWVLALTVVLADGTVVRTRQRPRKSAAGYDLTRLLVGSEGTLGLVTEATLKLAVRPPETSRVWTGDVAVPISRLPEAIEAAQADLAAAGLAGTIVGHVGDGNFHTIVLYDHPAQRPAAEEFVHRMVKRAIALEGTVTGEHGVGLVKRDYLPHELGEETVAAMRKIKAAFDPLCLLNCDKVVRMQKPKPGEVAEW
ncbi:d-lactate dehydrogenase [Niveomyces insectorum RCEF 264]|uniref:D-lactate dehydrogenase (cytochrome) n=1 Tax=Niveomyces insectorum RCEF 264 TaxID=1081102 RepID=A0A167NAD7_9HYPO|nr:d-lactate dehydrogenase [Niveomyces insectorum RCEF 264]